MTTTEQRLADALRQALAAADKQAELLKAGARDIPCPRNEARDAWREALAAYDAQRAAAPSDGAWRAEDYAVSSGEVGVFIKEGDDTVLDLPFMPAWPESVQRARAARIVACVNAHDALVSALRGVMPYAENGVSAILDLADDGDEHADEECEAATSLLEAARAALEAAGPPNA